MAVWVLSYSTLDDIHGHVHVDQRCLKLHTFVGHVRWCGRRRFCSKRAKTFFFSLWSKEAGRVLCIEYIYRPQAPPLIGEAHAKPPEIVCNGVSGRAAFLASAEAGKCAGQQQGHWSRLRRGSDAGVRSAQSWWRAPTPPLLGAYKDVSDGSH
jgi:hypothetical protein